MKLSLYLYFLRTGGDQDPAKLKYSMERLGFEVIVFKNQTTGNVEGLLKSISEMDLSCINLFGMAISSHGDEDNNIYLKDTHADLNFFIEPLKESVIEKL